MNKSRTQTRFLNSLKRLSISIFVISFLMIFSFALPPLLNAQDSDNTIRLIARGDDMGMSHAVNQAIIDAYKNGILSSTEVIVPAPWFPDAVKLLNEHPSIDTGVHLALTSEWDRMKWRPVSPSPSLTDSLGYFYPFIWTHDEYGDKQSLLGNNWKLDEVEREFRRQIEIAVETLPNVTHLSYHMGVNHMHPDVTELAKEIAADFGLDIHLEDFDVQSLRFDSRPETNEEMVEQFITILRNLEPGNYLYVAHPSLDTPEDRAMSHIGYTINRHGDYDILISEKVQEVIRELGIEVISYPDLLRTR